MLTGLEPLVPWPVWLRAIMAALISLVCVRLAGPNCIRWLALHCREPIRSASPQLNALLAAKHGTPTLGGLFLIAGWLAGILLCANLNAPSVAFCLVTSIVLAAIGLVDDAVKLRTARRGLSARAKLAAQFLLLAGPAWWIAAMHSEGSTLPTALLVALVLVAASNAVNLTDGLDGLACGSLLPVIVALGAIGLLGATLNLTSHGFHLSALPVELANADDRGELAVVAAALAGAIVAFLPLNVAPARVFLGNTGSLALGGALGSLGVLLLPVWLLAIAAGLFVCEAASVILQIATFRATGRRLFRCAPLHHHFQFLGWSERRIVRIFWGASVVCVFAACGLAGTPYQIVNNFHAAAASPTLTAPSRQDSHGRGD
ncbi:MAG: phospho-N-acetylmuramoyl-pentapeptide-transferase [Pirellulales bacterium]|nr:phospho-N-acetylmuramoyl-pentapeptide-transferase [Pirellulales bacterium]